MLVVDIGNSTVSFGVFELGNLVSSFNLPNYEADDPDSLVQFLGTQLSKTRLRLSTTGAWISSVVPRLSELVAQAIRHSGISNVRLITSDLLFPLKIGVKEPATLGMDRFIGACAAFILYRGPLITVDMGTATTFNLVSSGGVFIGGAIGAGFQTIRKALASSTAMLPSDLMGRTEIFTGRDSRSSIESGLFHMYTGGVSKVINGIISEYGEKIEVIVATGGNSSWIARSIPEITHVDEQLVLRGINIIASTAGVRE